MNYIVVIIKELNFYKVIFEDEFIDSPYRTQNIIREVLSTLGFENPTVDLYYRTFNKEEN